MNGYTISLSGLMALGACVASQDLGNTAPTTGATDATVSELVGDGASLPGSMGDGGQDAAVGTPATDGGVVVGPASSVLAVQGEAGDEFGARVALSTDGLWLAVGAPGEDSASAGVNGVASDNSASNSGAVYIFQRNGTTWSQVAYVKSQAPRAAARFGDRMALSGDGTTLVVGDATREGFGASDVYVREAAGWRSATTLRSPSRDAGEEGSAPFAKDFGVAVATSDNGNLIAVSEPKGACNLGAQQPGGCVHVFKRPAIGSPWTETGRVYGDFQMNFGAELAMSGDGSKLVLGDSIGAANLGRIWFAGVDPSTGEAFSVRSAPGLQTDGRMGAALAVDRAGFWALVGAPGIASLTGYAGAAHLMSGVAIPTRDAVLVAPGGVARSGFGSSVAMTPDGFSVGFGTGQLDPTTPHRVQVFDAELGDAGRRGNLLPTKVFGAPASSPANAGFGSALAVDETGAQWAVGAPHDNGAAADTGAVHVFRR